MYTPLSLHTHYSLLRGLSKPVELAHALAEKNIGVAAITDFDKVSGAVAFAEACQDNGIKSILGSKILIGEDGGYVTVIAKNKAGWRELAHVSSISHDKAHLKTEPCLRFEELAALKNVIIIMGEPESALANAIVANSLAYVNKNPQNYLSFFLHGNYDDKATELLERYKAHFGENLFIAVQRMNSIACPIDTIVADKVTQLGIKLGIKRVAVPNSFYLNKADKFDHNLLLCSFNKFHWKDLNTSIETEEHARLSRFVNDDNCHLPTSEEMASIYTEDEIKNSILVGDMCEQYSILANPTLPDFVCPPGMTQPEYLKQLCREGWKRLTPKLDLTRTSEYVARIEQELGVFGKAGLEGYFLIVQDFVNWAKNQNILVGCSRGSAGGCLVSYLTNIITIDPIINELYFERFYNEGRNSPGKISHPDIDVDIPVFFRERIFAYLKVKYGEQNVSQVCTFSSLQGRGAIKEVLRIHGACPQDQMNEISKRLPQKHEIEDKLNDVKETSVIRWFLNNDPDTLADFVVANGDGTYSGPMASYFEQAIRIEGTYKSYGKHASALVISPSRIDEICPMLNDKTTGELIVGIEYESAEKMGIPKFDILGLSTLDKLMGVNQLLKTGNLRTTEFDEVVDEDY